MLAVLCFAVLRNHAKYRSQMLNERLREKLLLLQLLHMCYVSPRLRYPDDNGTV